MPSTWPHYSHYQLDKFREDGPLKKGRLSKGSSLVWQFHLKRQRKLNFSGPNIRSPGSWWLQNSCWLSGRLLQQLSYGSCMRDDDMQMSVPDGVVMYFWCTNSLPSANCVAGWLRDSKAGSGFSFDELALPWSWLRGLTCSLFLCQSSFWETKDPHLSLSLTLLVWPWAGHLNLKSPQGSKFYPAGWGGRSDISGHLEKHQVSVHKFKYCDFSSLRREHWCNSITICENIR